MEWLAEALVVAGGAFLLVCVAWKLRTEALRRTALRRHGAETLLLFAFVGGLVQYAATKGTNGTDEAFAASFGHLSTTNGEFVTLWFWDDANSNAVMDVTEAGESIAIRPSGHVVAYSGSLPAAAFDLNRNGLKDWWEVQTGLSALDEAHGETDDNDHDGLINLYEYWAGTNPLLPDGSNTLLSVCSRSIDERLDDNITSNEICRFVDFTTLGEVNVFLTNSCFWLKDVDCSCVSVWHKRSGNPGEMAITAVTRKHGIASAHWFDNTTNVFVDVNGIATNMIVDTSYKIPGTDMLLVRFENELPETVQIPKVMAPNFGDYIGDGKYLPILCLNQKKDGTILEMESFDTSVMDSGAVFYQKMGHVMATNYVSLARSRLRAMTLAGNSGTPHFLLIGSDLVFLFSKHLGYNSNSSWGDYWGPMISFRLDQIQNKIDFWEGENAFRYRLDVIDLSCFDRLNRRR